MMNRSKACQYYKPEDYYGKFYGKNYINSIYPPYVSINSILMSDSLSVSKILFVDTAPPYHMDTIPNNICDQILPGKIIPLDAILYKKMNSKKYNYNFSQLFEAIKNEEH